MGYRPICDLWLLTRARLKGGEKYWGAYPGGFLERARALLGVAWEDPVLHVCGGKVRAYPYAHALGPNDRVLDLDPAVDPDYCQDAREPWPRSSESIILRTDLSHGVDIGMPWAGVLCDPPYTAADAAKYVPGAKKLPTLHTLVCRAYEVLPPGRRVGLLHYKVAPRLGARFIALVAVSTGANNAMRSFTVLERPAVWPAAEKGRHQ